MPNRYIQRDATTGRLRELLAAQSSTGAADANRIVALDADGLIDPSMIPASISNVVVVAEADEALGAGDVVHLFDDAGTTKVALASAETTGEPAIGYVLDSWLAGENAVVFLSGLNDQVSGLTAGQRIYLGVTAGDSVTSPVTGADRIHQFLGRAIASTSYNFEPDDEIILAA